MLDDAWIVVVFAGDLNEETLRLVFRYGLMKRLAEWKLRCSANVFWCSGVIWCCRFSRSTRRGTLVEILEVWKLQRLAHVFWCLGVIWCCRCHYVLHFLFAFCCIMLFNLFG
jgi:hypothetical protein